VKPYYQLGELARLLSGGAEDSYGQQAYKRARRTVHAAGVPIKSIPRPTGGKPILVVYLSDLRTRWPDLYDSLALAQTQASTCKLCHGAMRCDCCE
jgi:hypothetical protein